MNIENLNNIKTKYIAKKVLYFEEIDSTQKEAQRRINNNIAKNGEIIIANKQTAAEGTHGRKWYTGECENIAFSLVLFPNCNINLFKDLTLIIAKSLVDVLKQLYNIDIQIKNPNDIVYNNLKLGGILTQTITVNEIVKNLVIGIGLNVNELNFSKEIEDIATSLKREFVDYEFSREDIIKAFCEKFEVEYSKMLSMY